MLTSSPVISNSSGGGGVTVNGSGSGSNFNSTTGPTGITFHVSGSNVSASLLYTPYVVQTQWSTDNSVSSGTTGIPLDNTIPQITEGTQFLSKVAQSIFGDGSTVWLITVEATFGRTATSGAIKRIVGALFEDSTANALDATVSEDFSTTGGVVTLNLSYVSSNINDVSPHTFKFRVGVEGSGTVDAVKFNSTDGSNNMLGGSLYSKIIVSEVLQLNYPAG
jgi:hypothetical protein